MKVKTKRKFGANKSMRKKSKGGAAINDLPAHVLPSHVAPADCVSCSLKNLNLLNSETAQTLGWYTEGVGLNQLQLLCLLNRAYASTKQKHTVETIDPHTAKNDLEFVADGYITPFICTISYGLGSRIPDHTVILKFYPDREELYVSDLQNGFIKRLEKPLSVYLHDHYRLRGYVFQIIFGPVVFEKKRKITKEMIDACLPELRRAYIERQRSQLHRSYSAVHYLGRPTSSRLPNGFTLDSSPRNGINNLANAVNNLPEHGCPQLNA